MKNRLEILKKEFARALDLVNHADAAVEKASAKVNSAMKDAIRLQKVAYEAQHTYKDKEAAEKSPVKVKSAMEEAMDLQKAAYKAQRDYKDAGNELTKCVRLAHEADVEYRKLARKLAEARKEIGEL